MRTDLQIKPNEAGENISRLLKALVLGRGDAREAYVIAKNWAAHPSVYLTLEKGLTQPLTSSDLASFGLSSEFHQMLKRRSLLARLSDQMRRTVFKTKTPVEGSGTMGAWVPESGGQKPVKTLSYSTVELNPSVAALIVVVTNELAKVSHQDGPNLIRQALVNAVSSFLDSAFLGSDAAIAGERPAGIGNGQQVHVSTGASAAQIQADLAAMGASVASWQSPCWIMRPATLMHLSLMGLVDALPGGPQLCTFPVYTTPSSPQQIMLVDLDSVFLADPGEIRISTATEGQIVMDDGASPASSSVVGLWQQDLTAIRCEKWISWQAGHSAAACVMTTAY